MLDTLINAIAGIVVEIIKDHQIANGSGTFPTDAEMEAVLHTKVAVLLAEIAAEKASKIPH